MNRKFTIGIYSLLLCICLNFGGCSVEDDEKDFNHMIVEQAEQLAEEGTFEEGDIYVDSIHYGYYSQTDEWEMLALCKINDNVHTAGLDRTLAIIFAAESMDVVAYKNFGTDEVTLQCLPTEGESKILFLGRSSYTGLTTQYVELYTIQEKEWVEIPLEEIRLKGDELCYITDDNNLIVLPRENGAYPTQMFVLWDEQIMYSWDEQTERFVNKQISAESAEKIVWGDLDGDGQQEYFILSGDGPGTLALYFNNELIYQYEEKDFVLSITCEGCDQEIIYDATNHYEQKKEEEKEWNDNSYTEFVGSNFKAGDEVGSTSAWGIWNMESGTYEGRNCLIAEHGLQGPNGKYDFYGYLDVYFDYDENAQIRILNIDFREKVEEPSENSQASEIGEHKTDMLMAE